MWWIIFPHSYLHVTHDEISVCLDIWLIWWANIIVIKIINTPGHVLSPGWPLCKQLGLTLIKVSQYAYLSYQAFRLSRPFIFCNLEQLTWFLLMLNKILSESESDDSLLFSSTQHMQHLEEKWTVDKSCRWTKWCSELQWTSLEVQRDKAPPLSIL